AEALHVTPSAVSRQISILESTCGHVLLERLTRGVAPTEAGRVVAEFAQRQVQHAELLLDRLRTIDGVRQATIRLWCGDGLIGDLLLNGLPPVLKENPHIAIRLVSSTTDAILEAVSEGVADIGLAYHTPAHPDVEAYRESQQPVVAIVSSSHRFVGKKSMRLKQFEFEPAALHPRGHAVRELLGRVEAQQDFRLRTSFETVSHEAMRLFVRTGLGVTFAPAYVCENESLQKSLAVVPLAEPVLTDASVQLLVKAGRKLPETVEALALSLARKMKAFASTC
ncbi:LysR family transcriptional regulator, partial [Caballeronia glebae]|uniref:LysR family transcriptional regulator n=1 Tax=Caballeronia glebae TaxID=1777143 RepID=UPI0038BB198D